MLKRSAPAVLGVLLLAGCSEVNSAVDQANDAADKASVCTKALGLADLNPNVDPQKLQAGAEEKANKLRELGQQAVDQDVKQTLLSMADSYAELEQKQADQLGNINEWIQRNTQQLDQLRQACT
ncbi:hypothetical protein [Qaidamihabitans albus]|uniref:hypothetical protein n=1 Tax=Qaidamihabitans albus TaxID=2795733 RepID=UPI0018F1556E|nr:hypothetical protein [Qaidamihabitans albus]